jgi:hypothetical protein
LDTPGRVQFGSTFPIRLLMKRAASFATSFDVIPTRFDTSTFPMTYQRFLLAESTGQFFLSKIRNCFIKDDAKSGTELTIQQLVGFRSAFVFDRLSRD